jgi:hypothetical protein
MGEAISLIILFIFGMVIMYGLMRLRMTADGQIVIERDEDTGKLTYILELNKDPADLKDKDRIIFKVTEQQGEGYVEPV